MIAIFARANHPHGFGYSAPHGMAQWPTSGVGAHGYSVVGFRCRSKRQVDQVIEHVRTYGIDLPDSLTGRTTYYEDKLHGRAPGNHHNTDIGQPGVVRWYSGGPDDWDYLFTVRGSSVDWEWPMQAEQGSRGDNRWCMVYEASQLLRTD